MHALYHHVPAFKIDCTTCTTYVTDVRERVSKNFSIDTADHMRRPLSKLCQRNTYPTFLKEICVKVFCVCLAVFSLLIS